MKTDTIEILCCPVCKGDLELITTEMAETKEGKTDVLTGILRCNACSIDYPITEGIPNLLVPEKKSE